MTKLVGVPEIAEMLMKSTVEVMAMLDVHKDFPEPIADLANGKVWERGPVRRWAKRNKIFVVPEPDEIVFPIVTEFIVGTTKDDNSYVAQKLGLSGDAAEAFRYTALEVKLTISVDVHGTATATHFNDIALVTPVVITD